MSGRKKSEVMDVLQEAEKTRNRTNGNLDNSIIRDSESIKQAQQELKDIQQHLEDGEELTQEAKDMFGKNAEQQAKQRTQMLQELRGKRVSDTFAKTATEQLRRLEEQLKECDKEAAAIRRAVASKPHYCDEEYKRANQLKQRYKRLSDARKELADNVSKEVKAASENITDARRLRNELKNSQAAIKEMNVIAENRVQANEWKETLQHAIEDMPLETAKSFKKFDCEEFERIDGKIKDLMNKDDVTINKKAPELMGELNSYKAKLVATLQLWEKQRTDANALFEQTVLIQNECFIDSVDDFQNGEDAEKIPLFEYIDRYVKNDYGDKYEKFVKSAERAMQQENFVDAYNQYEQASIIAKEAKNKALSLQETMFKNLDIAIKINEAMSSLGYDVDSQLINDNPNDGFRILCTCGDEIIDFTRIAYDESGKPVVDIDHTESRTGTCGKSWEVIVKKMREDGLPIEAPRLANGEPIWRDRKPGQAPGVQAPGTREQI